MVIDEIQKLRAANEAAAKAGEAQVSITGKLIKAMFSFNTVLVLVLTAFSIWGKDITNWIGSLFTGKKRVEGLTSSLKHMADAMQNARLETAKETLKLNLLYKTATNNAKSTTERTKAVKALKREYPEYFKNLSDEEIKLGKASKAYKEATKAITENAKARAALDKITELQKEFIDTDQKRIGLLTKQVQAQGELAKAEQYTAKVSSTITATSTQAASQYYAATASNVNKLKDDIKEYGDEAEKAALRQKVLAKSMENLTKYVTVDSLTGKDTNTDSKKKEFDLLKAYEESRVALIVDARKKEEAEIREAARSELAKLEKDTTEKQRATQQYADTVYNIEAKLRRDLERLREKWDLEDLQKSHDFMNERLRAVRAGTGEELLLQTYLLENERKQDELRIKQSTDTEAVKNERLLILQRAYQLASIKLQEDFTKDQNNRIISRSVFRLQQEQQASEAEFNIVQRSAKEQEVFRLNAERQKWEQILELTRLYGSKITGYEVKTVEDTIAGIDNAIKQKASGWDSEQGVFGNLFDLVFGGAFGDKGGKSGKERSEEFKQSIADASEYAIENLKSVAQARVEAAEKAVQAAEKEVSARQKVLDAEIQARANGYANNVATAQKELDFARKQQEKALRDKKKAQKQQERIDTLMQASSLVTATANLWKDLGLAAIPAIALMWGSFAFAKIKASQLSKASDQTEEYGNGTVEMIDYGGSHASGNDVDLGTTKDGKRRRVERGEYFAVINKRSSQRYRRLVPDLINSLNKGTFEQKYLNAYSGADEVTNIMQGGNVDLSNVERDLKSIKESAGHKFITGADGTIIEVKGNVKRIIKTK
mgnify:FL=1